MLLNKLLLLLLLSTLNQSFVSIHPYFSKTQGGYYKGGVDTKIIQDIANASKSIKIAMYYLTNKNITKAIVDAHIRGLKVQIITDDKKKNTKRYRYLQNQGIIIEDDHNTKALMHNKVLIIDSKIVWIGSGNYTVYAFYRNHDNYLRLNNRAIARYYTQKFDILYQHKKESLPPYISESIEIYFAPDSNIEEKIIKQIAQAQKSIYIMMFAFTNKKIAKALLLAMQRGIEVKIVVDKVQNHYQKYSVYKYLKNNGMNIIKDKNRFKLHHKVLIIDKTITITGSYNLTKKANQSNAENIIIIKNTLISKKYLQEFDRVSN